MRAFRELEYNRNFSNLKRQLEELLPITKIIHLSGVDPEYNPPLMRAFYESLSDSLGFVADVDEDASTGGVTGKRWVDIGFDPDKQQYYRHSKNFQPFHNDAAYVPNAPEIAFFYCEKQAPSGGESIFLDATDLIYLATRSDPDLLEKLETVDVEFRKGDRFRDKPIVTYDNKGPLLNWIESRVVAPNKFTKEFSSFLMDCYQGNCHYTVSLKPGDAVFFHDERVFHGRKSFSAEKKGDRLLWKGGIRLYE